AAPEFVAERLEGGALRLSEFRGKLILIDFWATWCGPCLAEMPGFQKIHERFGKDPRFVLLGLSSDNSPEIAKRFVDSKDFGWRQAFVGNAQGRVPTDYTVRALPATFLIGHSGRVLAKNLKGDDLEQAIAAALADNKLFE